MKSSKHQDPSSREAPSTKLAKVTYWSELNSGEPLDLREEGQRHAFDLEERTAVFGEAIVRFCKRFPRHPANDRIIGQLTGAGTSVGANYCEANEAQSKKDFRCTINRCVKEAKETKFFLRMAAAAESSFADEARKLYREAKELHLIFATMFRK